MINSGSTSLKTLVIGLLVKRFPQFLLDLCSLLSIRITTSSRFFPHKVQIFQDEESAGRQNNKKTYLYSNDFKRTKLTRDTPLPARNRDATFYCAKVPIR